MISPQQQQLGDEIVRRLRGVGHDDARLDTNGFRVALAGGFLPLSALWSLRGDAAFEATLDRWVLQAAAIQAPDADPEIARGQLRPRVSARALHTRLALQGKLADRPYTGLAQAVTHDLVVDVVYTFPDRRVPVTAWALGEWGLSPDEALDLSIAQHHRETRWVERSAGVFTTQPDDGASAAMLQWAHEACRPALALRGEAVFLPLREDVLYVVGADDPGAIATMLASAARVGPGLSATPLVFNGEAFVPFTGVDPEALHGLQRTHALRLFPFAYGQPWEPLLEAVYGVKQAALTELDGQLVAVAPGWPCLVPQADRVQVGDSLVSMADVGPADSPVEGLHPPVWLCDGPPAT